MDFSPHKSLLATVENRLESLVWFLKVRLEERIGANPAPEIIVEVAHVLTLKIFWVSRRFLRWKKGGQRV